VPLHGEPLRDTLPKPERRRYVKNREKAKKKLTRAQVLEIVYRRKKMLCERCGRRVKRFRDCAWEGDPAMAHVNETTPRSKGGDPMNPDHCELVCQACHMPNGQHAPTVERMKKLQRRTA
jgi:5-methylcytosine-specific restriction endonuclease McrA